MRNDIEALAPTEREPRIGQVVRWHLADSRARETQRDEHIRAQAEVWDTYTTPGFRSVRFEQINAVDMQKVIDRTAASGAEKASVWLRRLFADTDKFATAREIIPASRAKRLMNPIIDQVPRSLSDVPFQNVWKTYSYCAVGGAVVDRGPCLAVLISAITLQPLGNIVSMRRDEIDIKKGIWASGDPRLHVHLSDLTLDHIRQAIELADFMHREVSTPFVFPSGGSKRDPYRYVSYSGIYDLTKRLLGKNATPHDLRRTGIEALRSQGGRFWDFAKPIVKGGTEQEPGQVHVAILDGWAERIGSLTNAAWR